MFICYQEQGRTDYSKQHVDRSHLYTDCPRTPHAEVPGLNLGSLPNIWRTGAVFHGWTDQDCDLFLDLFDGIYCGMEMNIGLQSILLTIFYHELPSMMQVTDSGSLNYQVCLSIAPIKREKLQVKL